MEGDEKQLEKKSLVMSRMRRDSLTFLEKRRGLVNVCPQANPATSPVTEGGTTRMPPAPTPDNEPPTPAPELVLEDWALETPNQI